MSEATFRFYAELNDFLPKDQREVDFPIEFNGHETVKHLLESLGVPHTEVDIILVNGKSVDFSHRLRDGDQVGVYPPVKGVGEATSLIRLHPVLLYEPRFVLDGHLGKLAAYLRLLGFDSVYRNDFDDAELAEMSSQDGRILLTRDRGLLKRTVVTQGYCVREKSPKKQLVEIVRRFNLTRWAKPFSRCARCNGVLKPVSKAKVYDRLEPKTKLYYNEFRICEGCNQIYWKGSHFERMEKFIGNVLKIED